MEAGMAGLLPPIDVQIWYGNPGARDIEREDAFRAFARA
jgi:hypothetical protein